MDCHQWHHEHILWLHRACTAADRLQLLLDLMWALRSLLPDQIPRAWHFSYQSDRWVHTENLEIVLSLVLSLGSSCAMGDPWHRNPCAQAFPAKMALVTFRQAEVADESRLILLLLLNNHNSLNNHTLPPWQGTQEKSYNLEHWLANIIPVDFSLSKWVNMKFYLYLFGFFLNIIIADGWKQSPSDLKQSDQVWSVASQQTCSKRCIT